MFNNNNNKKAKQKKNKAHESKALQKDILKLIWPNLKKWTVNVEFFKNYYKQILILIRRNNTVLCFLHIQSREYLTRVYWLLSVSRQSFTSEPSYDIPLSKSAKNVFITYRETVEKIFSSTEAFRIVFIRTHLWPFDRIMHTSWSPQKFSNCSL